MITNYPLHWPAGWKRTEAFFREDARFGLRKRSTTSSYARLEELSIAEGVQRVLKELQAMGIKRDDLVISSNVPTRMDGFPRSDARNPEDPGVSVWWETKSGGKKVMAIDRYRRAADNLAAVAATLDALRAIERHGGGTILDRAFAGFTPLPAPGDSSADHWQAVLELGPAATLEEANAAYRRLRGVTHPDRPGGSDAAFNRIQKAWEAARDALGGHS